MYPQALPSTEHGPPGAPAMAGDSSMAPDDLEEIASRLRIVVGALYRRFRQNQDGGLTPAQLSLLATVEAFGPIRLGDLAEREGVQPSTLTRSVHWLVQHGLAERQVSPEDRRSTIVVLTPDGSVLLDRLRERRTAAFARRLDRMPAGDFAKLERALPALESLIDRQQTQRAAQPGAASAAASTGDPSRALAAR
jgi:DNA-binding MarR family transcriptional regulator